MISALDSFNFDADPDPGSWIRTVKKWTLIQIQIRIQVISLRFTDFFNNNKFSNFFFHFIRLFLS